MLLSRTVVKSRPALIVVFLCLFGVVRPAVAQGREGPPADAAVSSQSTGSVTARLAAQNALFKEQFEDDARASPESETAGGDYRDNAILDDYSLAASMKQNAVDRAYRAKLDAISTEGFPEQDRLSHDLLVHVLDNRITDYELKDYEMPVSQMQGIHNSLADLPNSVPLDTVEHYKDYIARLHQIPQIVVSCGPRRARIQAIDGLPSKHFTLRQAQSLFQRVDAEHHLTVQRGSQLLNFDIKLRKLL